MAKKPLANKLRVLRAERGFTQYETADLAGISRHRYWRIEQGDLDADQAERDALVRIFAVSATDIFPSEVNA
jgi:transcriptional regulator with XRE-family HTH domain